MPRYAAQLLQGTVSTAYKSLGALQTGGTTRRIGIYEIVFGLAGALNTTNDTQVLPDVSRFTSTSLITGTAFTPNPLDGADPASLATFNNNLTSEPAAIAAAGSGLSMLNPALNQRGTFRWRALDDGDNIIIPNTALNGVAVRALSLSYTGTAIGTIMYIE